MQPNCSKEVLDYYNIRMLGKPFAELDSTSKYKPKIIRGYIYDGIKYYEKDQKLTEEKPEFSYESIKIVRTYWVGYVGFVLFENNNTKKQMVRIGACRYESEVDDIRSILDYGEPLFLEQAKGFFPKDIRDEDYIMSSDGLEDWFKDDYR